MGCLKSSLHFLGCPSQNVENGQRPPTQNVESEHLSLVVLVENFDFWKVLGLARNPSKKMRLDESFRTVPVSFHLEVVVKSYGQITEIVLWPIFRQNVESVGGHKCREHFQRLGLSWGIM